MDDERDPLEEADAGEESLDDAGFHTDGDDAPGFGEGDEEADTL